MKNHRSLFTRPDIILFISVVLFGWVGCKQSETHVETKSEPTELPVNSSSPEAIAAALQRLEAAARQNGFAIGTGAGLPTTIKVIEQWHRSLGGRQIQLVPVTAAFASRRG